MHLPLKKLLVYSFFFFFSFQFIGNIALSNLFWTQKTEYVFLAPLFLQGFRLQRRKKSVWTSLGKSEL